MPFYPYIRALRIQGLGREASVRRVRRKETVATGDDIVRAKRAANEQTVAAARRFELDEVVLLCECTAAECAERVVLETERYGDEPAVVKGHV